MIIYNILEVANTHGGDIEYVFALLDEFSDFDNSFGIKFQPFKYDLIATKEYSWYETYKTLFFKEKDWSRIIEKAHLTKEIWVDLFDSYSIKILKSNFSLIKGIKLQSSVLLNKNLLNELKGVELKNIELIINVSGYTLEFISQLVETLSNEFSFKKIILQVGFQNYPTELSDSGLSKISHLLNKFYNNISFADHIDSNDEESIRLPIVAIAMGATYIEKHICHSSLETKFDHFSSLNFKTYKKYIAILDKYLISLSQKFINTREAEYLRNTIQIPITSKKLKKGKPLNLDTDLLFRRSKETGLSLPHLEKLNQQFNILSSTIEPNKTFSSENFKKATIATIIAVRMKSTRLPRKAILNIGNISSIELCLKNCLKFENVNHTVLATSTENEDSELRNYTYAPSVVFHRGDPDDVIQRYLDVIDSLKIDVVIRLTGDCPYPSNDILQIVLKSHFKNGADYSRAQKAAIGTNVEIINTSSLKKIKQYFPKADFSEYMTYYFTNNPKHFYLNFVELPDLLVRDYRLTLDYKEDLELFRKIEAHFHNQTYSISNLFSYLDANPEIARINSNCDVKYFTDTNLIAEIDKNTTIKT